MRKQVFFLLLIICNACQTTTKKQETASIKTIEKPIGELIKKTSLEENIFTNKITIILVEEPDSNSNALKIQDYVANGMTFIPVFTSKAEFEASTGRSDIGKPLMELNGLMFLSLLKGKEIIKVNPALSNEQTFNSTELMLQFQTEIDSIHLKMKALENNIN